MTGRSTKRAGRIFALLLSALMLLSLFSGNLTLFAASDTYDLYKNGKTTSVSISKGQSISTQFNVSAEFDRLTLEVNTGGANKVVRLSLHKWNQNVVDSVNGAAIASKDYSDWDSEFVFDLNEIGAGAQSAGEYVLHLQFLEAQKETTKIKFKVTTPAMPGTLLHYNLYEQAMSPIGTIHFTSAVENPFQVVSDNVNYPYHQAPAEYVYPEDSPVVQLGIDPTQWNAVDGLGRTLSGYDKVGAKNDKVVGIFYWTWHQGNMQSKAVNVNNLILEYPEILHDYKNKVWTKNNVGAYWWNESIYGYYTEADDYVLRKHAELLADAGIDFVLFDCTNGDLTWETAYLHLLEVWSQAREEGIDTPQVGFMMQFWWDDTNTPSSLKQVYNAIYKPGKYQDLWFYWEGKPLIMAQYEGLDKNDLEEAEILNFFTWRRGVPSYWEEDKDDSYWGWLHVYPQALYKNADGTVEMTTAGVAMNADYVTRQLCAMNGDHNMGRSYAEQEGYSYSYQYRGKTITVDSNIENGSFYGLNLQEQFDYAISVDPEIIFVTGWNEWIMGRFEEWMGVENAFPDQYNDENSRDIEPSKGALKDYYYYQLVENVRRFKGVSAPVAQSVAKTIDINGGTEQWNDEAILTFNHYTGNTRERSIRTWGVKYEGEAIRNDIKTAKVSFDADNVYFYVETVDPITDASGANWMRLLLDTGAATETSTDWEEFEYIINRTNPSGGSMSVEKSTGGWNWESTGTASYTVSGNVMQVSVPRSALGMEGTENISFGFKWCDNNLTDGDIMTLYTEGDAAPGGRFTFVFNSDASIVPDESDNSSSGKKSAGMSTGSIIAVSVAAGAAAIAAVAAAIVVVKKGKQE